MIWFLAASICLNMIVKNESDVIVRCLESVTPLIDHWVIVDTGSTDGTQQIIRDYLKDIPGNLYERPWVNFGHNRNEALELAKGKADYILFMDADDKLSFGPHFQLPELTEDFYAIASRSQGVQCLLPRLIKTNLNWRWYDVLHEYIMADRETHGSLLSDVIYVYIADGARSKDKEKYKKDALVLEKAMIDEPENPRYPFYLGQTYSILQNLPNALRAYRKREQMGGFVEEIFFSKLQIARTLEQMSVPPAEVEKSYIAAYRFRPIRAEPLYGLICRALSERNAKKAFDLASLALMLPQKDTLFVDQWIYEYGILYQYAFSAFYSEKYLESSHACEKILKLPQLPDKERNEIRSLQEKISSLSQESIQQKLLSLL